MKSTARMLLVAVALSTPLALSQTVSAASDTVSKSAESHGNTGLAIMPMPQRMQSMHEQMMMDQMLQHRGLMLEQRNDGDS